MSFIAQSIGGVGSGINSVCSMALVIAHSSKKERDQNIGFMEGFTGLGFLTGPLVGSIMFTFGGYMMPFFTIGCIYVLTSPIVIYNLHKAKTDRVNLRDCPSSEHEKQGLETYNPISIMKMFTSPRFVFGICSQSIVTGSISFLAPSLSLHLQMFGYTPNFIAISFCIPSLLYAALSPFVYLLTDRLPKRLVILFGIVLLTFGMFLVGQSDVLGLDADADFVLLGLCAVGVAAALMAIPVMPECLEAIESDPQFNYDPEEINNEISSIFVTSTGVGDTIGPIACSMLIEMYGYTGAQDIYASFLMCFGLLYFFLAGGFSILTYTTAEKERRVE